MSENRWRRRYYRVLIRPKAQLKLFAPFFVFIMAWTAIMLAAAWVFHGLIGEISGPAQSLSANEIHNLQILTRRMYELILWGSVFAVVLTFGFWLNFSHKVFGPMVQIHRQINRLKNGELSHQVRLRPDDEFHNVADSLNELTESLKSKTG